MERTQDERKEERMKEKKEGRKERKKERKREIHTLTHRGHACVRAFGREV